MLQPIDIRDIAVVLVREVGFCVLDGMVENVELLGEILEFPVGGEK